MSILIVGPTMANEKHSIADGEKAKREGLAKTNTRRNMPWSVRAARKFVEALLQFGETSMDAVHDGIQFPEGLCLNFLGAIPIGLARSGICFRAGDKKSSRKGRNAGRISVWRLVDRAAAVGWLSNNPEPSEGLDSIESGPTPLSEVSSVTKSDAGSGVQVTAAHQMQLFDTEG